MKKIIKLFKSSPKYTIKWDNYFEIYSNILDKYINKKITFVEVGVGNGGSLFMWKKFFGHRARIIGIELNPEAKKLEKNGFEIFIGDQANPNFWKNFYKQVGKIDILLDDGGHKNIQQITTFMESIRYIKKGGKIIVEDTHTSFMKKKGFKNPSQYSFINFCIHLIENMHRRNPMLEKNLNYYSKKIKQINFYDSVVEIDISENKNLKHSHLLENNKKLRYYFTDYRHKGNFILTLKKFERILGKIEENTLMFKVIRKIFHRNLFFSLKEKFKIKKYIKLLRL
tara:strand:+ start:3290 stop:4138 length:849 start_codon:yes stop_codon:yes gene_type:complete